jgi:hypothetical protein
MKRTVFLLIFLCLLIVHLHSQQVYSTSGGELIFGFSNVDKAGVALKSNMRFTCFLHLGHYWHYDATDHLGFFSGLALRNVGFIDYETYNSRPDIKTKRRNYSLGVPVAIKLGTLKNNFYLYGGAEYELMFHYKEKRFVDGDKLKSTDWFSDKVNLFMPSVIAGIQFPKGINLRFKYYLQDFLSDSYRNSPSLGNQTTQVYYLSLSYNLRSKEIKERLDKDKNKNFALR